MEGRCEREGQTLKQQPVLGRVVGEVNRHIGTMGTCKLTTVKPV